MKIINKNLILNESTDFSIEALGFVKYSWKFIYTICGEETIDILKNEIDLEAIMGKTILIRLLKNSNSIEISNKESNFSSQIFRDIRVKNKLLPGSIDLGMGSVLFVMIKDYKK